MKIAVTSTGPTLEDRVESRFGRCAYFLIIDPDSLAIESIPNPNLTLGGGAGLQSAQLMAEKNVSTVLTGNCGPNAFEVFGSAGIRVVTGVGGSVRQAVERFKSGDLNAPTGPSVQSHFGSGIGCGRGRGMRGGGRGRGRALAVSAPSAPAAQNRPASQSLIKGEDLADLKEQAESLQRQLSAVEARIQKLGGQ